MRRAGLRSVAVGAACFAAGIGFLLANIDNDFLLYVLTLVFVYGSLASSLDLLVGLTGRISMAHATFFGIGAYVCAITMIRLHWPFPVAGLAGVVATALVALAVGAVTIRISGMYFALATTSLAIAFTSIIQLPSVVQYTGGATGLIGIPAQPYLEDAPRFYGVFLAVLIMVGLISWNLRRSTAGLRMMAIRDDEELARTLGVFADRYKVAAFVLASSLAGLTGTVFVLFLGFLGPSTFDVWASFSVLVWVLVGGVGSVAGPILGAALLWTLPQVLQVQPDLARMIYGALLIATISFNRRGLMGLADRLWRSRLTAVEAMSRRLRALGGRIRERGT